MEKTENKSSMFKIEDIIDIAREAGKIMLTAERPKIMEKSGHANFCTETDEKIQIHC